jgi:two-component system nitrate/nitrite response regulator NarL
MNVVICDDQRLFTEALAMVLTSKGWNIVGAVVDPAQAVAVVAREHVDACLIDITFPGGARGIEGIETVHETSPHTKVVVLTASSDPQLIKRSVQAGADAVLFKDDGIDKIIKIVEQVCSRETSVTTAPRPTAPHPKTPPVSARDTDSRGRFLTDRECEVLQLLVRGFGGKHLALQMGISYSTARTHIQNILTKLGVHSRLEAVAYATDHNFYQPASVPQSASA